jgi:PST family polysaccharide transporter/lipopolysaccharide exporter
MRSVGALFARLKRLVTPGESLTQRSIAGGFWMGMTKVASRGLQIAMVVVLANLLSPAQFGVMGVALLMLSAMTRLSKLGLNSALIYNENENVNAYLNTTWTLMLARGLVLAGITVLIAPTVANVFGEPRLVAILPVMALGPLLDGVRNPGIVYFKKDLEFQRQFVYDVGGSLVQFGVAVGYALVNPTIWALVLGYIASSATRAFISYFLHEFNPRPRFDIERARELIGYGKWMTASNALNFVKNEGDDAFIGWFLAASSLGFYQMAYRLANAPATEISHVISGVAFPAYSKVQDDYDALRTGFVRVINLSTFIAFPVGIGIAAVAPTFTRAFLGEEWLPMVLTMQLFAIYGTSRSFASTFGSVWQAVGRPDLLTKLQMLAIVGMVIGIYPATDQYGIAGAAAVILVVNVVMMLPINMYVTVKQIDMRFLDLASEVVYPITASSVMGIVVWLVQANLTLPWAMLEFAVLVLVGIVVYTAAVLVLETQFNWGLRAELQSIQEAL